MQTSSRPARQNQSGYALVITLTFLVVTLIAFAAVMYWVSTNATVTQQNNLFTTSQAAAQGATETAITAMDRDFIYGSLNPSNVYMQLIQNVDQSSWPVQYIFSDTNGNQNQIYVSIQPQNWGTNYSSLNAQFTGLYGAVANIDVIAVATPTNAGYNMSATVENQAQLAAIPVFQFGVFYNLDLDFSPGQSLTMNGKVHCNGTIWMCPQANAYFNDVVEATVVVTNHDNPNDQQNLTFSSANVHYSKSGQPVSGVDSLNLPIGGAVTNNSPTNAETLFNLPPTAIAAPNSAAYAQTNQVYLYNECDLIISNSASGTSGALGTNITIFYQDNNYTGVSGKPLFPLTNNEICTYLNTSNGRRTNALYNGTTTNKLTVVSWNATNLYYSTTSMTDTNNWQCIASSFPFVTNVVFYDYRETKNVQAVQIDIAKLNNWLTNGWWEGSNWNYVCGGSYGMGGPSASTGSKGHPIDSIFVYNSVGSGALPAVRVVNGQQLPSHWGLTVATPMPIYTLGNYNIQTNIGGSQSINMTNTAWTWPAALMGDAITILSGSWSDSYISSTALSSRNVSSAVTVNAACLEGIVQSTNSAGTKHYSGGLENFLRLLENWNGTAIWYNGSIVVMFPSIYATNYWVGPSQISGYPTPYYSVPTRDWGFDSNFKYQQKSPPCAPDAKAIIRGNWITSGK